MKDLAPEIYRQRAIIEGYPNKSLIAQEIKEYLKGLSNVLKMLTLTEPVTHRSPKFGEAAWIHWESSGAHFYAWDQPRLFFSVDIYTCKPFNVADAIKYTKKFFEIDHVEFAEFTNKDYDGYSSRSTSSEGGFISQLRDYARRSS